MAHARTLPFNDRTVAIAHSDTCTQKRTPTMAARIPSDQGSSAHVRARKHTNSQRQILWAQRYYQALRPGKHLGSETSTEAPILGPSLPFFLSVAGVVLQTLAAKVQTFVREGTCNMKEKKVNSTAAADERRNFVAALRRAHVGLRRPCVSVSSGSDLRVAGRV